VRLTLTIQPTLDMVPVGLNLEGTATIQGREVAHLALPAEDMTQAFEYHHLVPSRELKLDLAGGYKIGTTPAKIVSRTPVRIPAGGTASVRIAAPSFASAKAVQFELRNPPKGITLKTVTPFREGAELVLQSAADQVKPGQRGNLTVIVTRDKSAAADQSRRPAAQRPLPTVPPIQFEIVKK